MRKLIAVLGAMLLFGMSAFGVMAQGASTPVAEEPAGGGSAIDPAIGDTVQYVDVSGNPVANVTIENVERNWQDFAEFYEPERGIEYVAFTVTVESVVTSGAVEVSDFDFSLQDTGGFFIGSTSVEAAQGVEVAPLQEDLQLASGESSTFLVVFEVLQDQELAHLFWQPESGRLITLAQLEGE